MYLALLDRAWIDCCMEHVKNSDKGASSLQRAVATDWLVW